jgi:hypothetical protein
MDGGHGEGSQPIAIGVGHSDDLLPLLGFVAGVAHPIAVQDAASEVLLGCERGHARDERLRQRPVMRPCRQGAVDVRGMQGRLTVDLCGDGDALPRPPGREAPQEEMKDARLAQCAWWSTLGP